MKNVLRIIFPAVLLMAFLSSPALAQNKGAAAQTGKIATVDMHKLFDGYWKTKQAEVALNDRKAELAKEDRSFIDDLNKAKNEYQKLLDGANDQAISADERDRRKQAAADKYKQITDSGTTIAQFERQADATLVEQSQRMRANILNEIKAAVAAKTKAAGYVMVLDIASETVNQTPIILYSSGENDLTSAVLAQLNETATVGLPKPDATTTPLLKISTNSP
jgi:Skp family chaperone for outer membrane proteins